MKKITLVTAIAALFLGSSAFAIDLTLAQSGANSGSAAAAAAGPGNGSALTTTQDTQHAAVTANATTTFVSGGALNHVDGSTLAQGSSSSLTLTTGNGIGASGSTGHSGANSGALANSFQVVAGQVVSGTVVGGAESRNTNSSGSASAGTGFGLAVQASGNGSGYNGNANATSTVGGTVNNVHTDGTAGSLSSINGTSGAPVVNFATFGGGGLAGNGALANFGNAFTLGAATAGNVSSVTP